MCMVLKLLHRALQGLCNLRPEQGCRGTEKTQGPTPASVRAPHPLFLL